MNIEDFEKRLKDCNTLARKNDPTFRKFTLMFLEVIRCLKEKELQSQNECIENKYKVSLLHAKNSPPAFVMASRPNVIRSK